MKRPITRGFWLLLVVVTSGPRSSAQVVSDCGCAWPEYRLQAQTIYEEQPVTTYRPVTETVMEERKVTTMRPVWETSYRERRYQVARPVTETSYREERYTVLRPVRETQYRDMSYDRIRYVSETQSRTERRVVQRPVVETQMREEQITVMRPVTETCYQDHVGTNLVPVTTYRQQVVDQGQLMDQVTYVPGPTRNRLRWLSGTSFVNPATGLPDYRRGGLYWVPQQRPGAYQVQRVYVPNPTVQQIAETSMVAQQYVQKVPVQVTRMQPEVQVRQVPVQVTRMQVEEEFRQVPVTVQRPVVERVENHVPVEVCRFERQEMVRQVPVTTCRMTYEDRVEQIPVRTCRMEYENKTIQIPRQTCRLVAETSMRRVARTVFVKVPVDPCGGCSIVSDSPLLSPSMTSPAAPVEPRRVEKSPTPAQPADESDSTTGEWKSGDEAPRGVAPTIDPSVFEADDARS
jgi:hypothetical protein